QDRWRRDALLESLGKAALEGEAPLAAASEWLLSRQAQLDLARHKDDMNRAWTALAPALPSDRLRVIAGGAIAVGLLVVCGLLLGRLTAPGSPPPTADRPAEPNTDGAVVVEATSPSSVPRYWDVAAAAKPTLALEAEGHTAAVKKVLLRDQGRQA